MYRPGDLVVYNGEGVCKIESVGSINMSGVSRDKVYYTIQPLYRDGKIYVPVDNGVYMRPVISPDQAHRLIKQLPGIKGEICDTNNLRMLNEHYQALLKSHDCEALFELIKAAYAKQKDNEAKGKKPGLVEERYLRRAEDILYGELAVALNIPKDTVCDYIINTLEHSCQA